MLAQPDRILQNREGVIAAATPRTLNLLDYAADVLGNRHTASAGLCPSGHQERECYDSTQERPHLGQTSGLRPRQADEQGLKHQLHRDKMVPRSRTTHVHAVR